MGEYTLKNVLRFRGFVRCVFKDRDNKKVELDFADKYDQYRGFKGMVGQTFSQKFIDIYQGNYYKEEMEDME